MCDPVTAIGLVLSAAKTVVGFVGARQEAAARQSAANAQAALLERQAQETEQQKQEELKIQRRDAQRAQADAEAKMAANGIDISGDSSGSLILADYAQLREEDAGQISLEAERRKRNLREDARIKVAEGNAAASAGRINAAGSLLVGGSQIASRWLRQG